MKRLQSALLAAIFFIAIIYSSCHKDRTYDVELKDGVRYVHNLSPKFTDSKVELEFIQQIGELEPSDENYLFSLPLSADEDEEGNIYILDAKECCVKKFSPEGKYLLRFGRPGQGPGEIEYPGTLDYFKGKILIASHAKYYFFQPDGKFLGHFILPQYQGFDLSFIDTNRFVGYAMSPRGSNSKDNKILKTYDDQGNTLAEFGEPFLIDSSSRSWAANMLYIACDSQGNIHTAFISQNRIEKYSPAGKLKMKLDRVFPFPLEYKSVKRQMEVRGEIREYMANDFTHVSLGIGIDDQDRIWVLTAKKDKPEKFDADTYRVQEYFGFEVFDSDGILLTKVPIPEEVERLDNWAMNKNHIFFVDPYGQACVYIYKTIWN